MEIHMIEKRLSSILQVSKEAVSICQRWQNPSPYSPGLRSCRRIGGFCGLSKSLSKAQSQPHKHKVRPHQWRALYPLSASGSASFQVPWTQAVGLAVGRYQDATNGRYSTFCRVVFQGSICEIDPRFSSGLAVSLRGSPEVTLWQSSFKALTWLPFSLTYEVSVEPNCLKSCIANLPERPAICMSANCNLPRCDGRSRSFTFPSQMILSSMALGSSQRRLFKTCGA